MSSNQAGHDGLRAALEGLERAWSEGGDTHLSARLGPGLTPEEIRAATAHLPLTLHEDVITWFGWHTSSSGSGPRIGGSVMQFLDVNFAVSLYRDYWRMAQEFIVELNWSPAQAGWDPAWFPLCETDGGDLLVADCSAGPVGPAPVYVRHKEVGVRLRPSAESLLVVVHEWIDSYRNGAYTWDGERWVEDFSKIPQWRLSSGLW